MNIVTDFVLGRESVMALGFFDGLHIGHRKVIGSAVSTAFEKELSPAALTFAVNNHMPDKKEGQGILLTDSIKFKIFSEIGVETLYMPDFDKIRNITAEEFADILINKLNVRHVVCGYDFRFGKGASGTPELLKQALGEDNVTIVEALFSDGAPVSSSRIRKALAEGDIELANRLLGYDYTYDFVVEHGRHLGTKMGFPTINQTIPDKFVVPRFGVYTSYVRINNNMYPSITNIGVKPTVGAKRPLSETFIIDFDNDLYDMNIPVSITSFVRPERKFDSVGELYDEIKRNTETAKRLFDKSRLNMIY